MNDIPYLMRGIRPLETASSSLISASPYLNEPRLRDWIETHFLRRSGKDLPTTSDAYKLYRILADVQDMDRIEALFTADRAKSPALDRWFSEGFVSTYSIADLLGYPEGSIGHIFGRYLADNGYQIDIVPRYEPKTQYDFFRLRSGQTHDLEHIVCGGGFDILGELLPNYARLANVPRFLDPELAGHVNLGQMISSTRIVMRTALHYHHSYPMALKAIQGGMRVGEQSGPMFMARYEDVFHLPVDEARAALGIVGAEDLDTREASLAWDEYR